MDESTYQRLADNTFLELDAMLADVDADAVDVERAGDVMTLTFASGKKAVVNTQRPTRQLWLAADARAWHFTWDGARWLDDRGRGIELFAQIAAIVSDHTGVSVTPPGV